MAQPRIAGLGFMLAAVLFAVAALIPVVRGGDFNATFLVLALVFFVLGAGVMRKSRATSDVPPPG
jgi:hypothetical protein